MKILFTLLILLMSLSQTAWAQNANPCIAPKIDTAIAPQIAGKPVEISLGFTFTDIMGISDPDQNIDADIAQIMEWKDPRLASLSGCNLAVPDVWTPRLELLNSSKLAPKYTQARNQVQVLDGGLVRYVQRYSGTISTYHNLSKFPFDTQNFKFRIFAPLYDASQLQLTPMENHIAIAPELNIEDWSFHSLTAETDDEALAAFDNPHSIMTFTLNAHRHVLYYVYKVFFPLALIVSMSWVVFWIPPSKFEAQIGFGATSMLTLIAFQFGLVNAVPKLNYFTSMDYLIFGATVLVYSAILEALVTGVLSRRGQEKRAVAIDRICRWLFPLIFVVYWLFVMIKSYW